MATLDLSTPASFVPHLKDSVTSIGSSGSNKTCDKLNDPLTFNSLYHSFVAVPASEWPDAPHLYSLALEFQTTELNAILAYTMASSSSSHSSHQPSPPPSSSSDKRPSSHLANANAANVAFLAIEIHNGQLQFYLGSTGSPALYTRHRIAGDMVANGRVHHLHVELDVAKGLARFKLDHASHPSVHFNTEGIVAASASSANVVVAATPYATSNEQQQLFAAADNDSDGGSESGNEAHSVGLLAWTNALVVGGIHPSHRTPSSGVVLLPAYFYAGMLEAAGFVGCLNELEINGRSVNMSRYLTADAWPAWPLGVTTDTCYAPLANQCDVAHCLNEGVCVSGWNRYTCDCAATGFNGPTCNQRKSILPQQQQQQHKLSRQQ